LTPGARLSSWRDLAAQLGVARGTVMRGWRMSSGWSRSGRVAHVSLRWQHGRRSSRTRATALSPPPSTTRWYPDQPRSRWACLHRAVSREHCSAAFVRMRYVLKLEHLPASEPPLLQFLSSMTLSRASCDPLGRHRQRTAESRLRCAGGSESWRHLYRFAYR
jgi:DNA-binding transcriptional MocR family regulator